MIEPREADRYGNRVWSVTTAPSLEPITADEIKLFARIDGTEEDTLIESFITAARQNCEFYLRRALLEQTITLKMDFWPESPIELPMPPLISITAVETLDESGTATTYASSNYYIMTESIPGQIMIKQSVSPPLQTVRDYGGYQIRYKAGYGTAAANVPGAIREGLKLWVTDIYENRVIRKDPPPEAMGLLMGYRVHRVG